MKKLKEFWNGLKIMERILTGFVLTLLLGLIIFIANFKRPVVVADKPVNHAAYTSDKVEKSNPVSNNKIINNDESNLRDYSRSLDSITKAPIDNSEDVKGQILYMSLATAFITEPTQPTDPQIKKRMAALKIKLINTQKKQYPRLRKAFVKNYQYTAWKNDIEVHIGGANNTTIEFVSGDFATHANIEEAQSTLAEILTNLRFKRVNYLWIPHDDNYTYYTLHSPSDGSIESN